MRRKRALIFFYFHQKHTWYPPPWRQELLQICVKFVCNYVPGLLNQVLLINQLICLIQFNSFAPNLYLLFTIIYIYTATNNISESFTIKDKIFLQLQSRIRFLEQSKKIKHNWAELEIFDICFSVNFDR